jgi:hypothetical protein
VPTKFGAIGLFFAPTAIIVQIASTMHFHTAGAVTTQLAKRCNGRKYNDKAKEQKHFGKLSRSMELHTKHTISYDSRLYLN